MPESTPFHLHRKTGLFVSLIAMLLLAQPAAAQLENYDKGRLIDALAEEGMADLLQRLIIVDPPTDPVDAKKLEIAQYKLRYDDPNLSRGEQIEAYESAMQSTRELIDTFYDHNLRPLWQTDLAEMILVEYLQVIHNNAAQFNAFGVPTLEQRSAFRKGVAEAYEATADADVRFFELRGELPRDPEHVAKRVNTGLWERMIEEYYLKRTQFFLSQSAYYTTLLPDDSDYFTSLQNNSRIINQKPDPASERERLLVEATRALLDKGSSLKDDAALSDAVLTTLGRIRLAQGDAAAADADFTKVISGNREDFYHFIASLGHVAVAQYKKEYDAGVVMLRKLESHPLAKGNLLYRLLLTDMNHRVRLVEAKAAPADQQRDMIAAAYRPYLELLGDLSLGENLEPLRGYIYRRWEANLDPTTDLALIPPVVRMAVGETARMQGQNLVIDGRNNNDQTMLNEGLASLDRSIEINRSLDAEGVDDAIRATAGYNLAFAKYLKNVEDLAGLLDAAETFTQVAEKYPAEPAAQRAITDGVTVLHNLHTIDPIPPGVDAAYRRATDVLFTRYDGSAAADDERVYYAYTVLQQNGQFDEAIAMYRRVMPEHPTFFDAQREMLFAMEQQMLQANGDQRASLLEALDTACQSVMDQAAPVAGDNDSPNNVGARRAIAGARLVRAQAAYEKGDVDAAVAHLDGMEQQFADQPDLVRLALERRIVILAGANRADPLADAARQMMAGFPDDAAAVIDQVLTLMDQEIERQRVIADNPTGVQMEREAASEKIDTLANTATILADLLAQWAQGQGLSPQQLVAYDLIRVKVLLLAQQPEAAVEIMEPILQAFGATDLSVLNYAGETYYLLGIQNNDNEALIRAAGYYDQIIGGLDSPYPEPYWNAWMRRLQINDHTNQFTDTISRTVRRLEMQDPNLGGPRYSKEFQRLARKHGG